MSNQKYTPGPWASREKFNGCTPIDAWDGEDSIEICCVSNDGVTDGEQEANANLLAAAPELLAALEDVTAELSRLHSHHHPACEGGCPTVEYIMNARKAIAKANGG